ncbi:lactosylceramide 4-alpha-galactosyltransferase-like [Penaeus japonicus]|uniref:lactosylceramide 4-alpha-galactosyltransferase-like n=1 Tax=Penaeus japonicus TaxID=27405 RepID=UPI001C70FF10|nr:lactosylceramide 4-alpha-galactosyltransferase-like [Penaeus japonicus]
MLYQRVVPEKMNIRRPRAVIVLVASGILFCLCYLQIVKKVIKINIESLVLRNTVDSNPDAWWTSVLCKGKTNETFKKIVLPLLMRDITPGLDNNVFLVESACKSTPTYRAWCAVESFARENPKAEVWYVMTTSAVNNTNGLPGRLLDHYPNLHVVSADLDMVFNNTLLEEFFTSGAWYRNTPWPMIQISDLLRVLLVWRYGGFYSDTDTVCLKSISPLKNVIVTSTGDRNHIANGVFHFTNRHEFITFIMSTMTKMYSPRAWGSMGPNTFNRCTREYCKLPNLQSLFPKEREDPIKCGNITVLPEYYLLPYPWNQYRKIFREGGWKNFIATHKKTYAIHAYGKVNGGMLIKVGSNSIYEGASRTFCPISYFHATANSSVF